MERKNENSALTRDIPAIVPAMVDMEREFPERREILHARSKWLPKLMSSMCQVWNARQRWSFHFFFPSLRWSPRQVTIY